MSMPKPRPKCEECFRIPEGPPYPPRRNIRYRCHCGCNQLLCNTHLRRHGDMGAWPRVRIRWLRHVPAIEDPRYHSTRLTATELQAIEQEGPIATGRTGASVTLTDSAGHSITLPAGVLTLGPVVVT